MAGAALCVTMFVPKVTGRKVKGEVIKTVDFLFLLHVALAQGRI